VIWQQSKGCRARNEAIAISSGEYIVLEMMISEFPKFYSQSHLVLQTYNAGALVMD
jgi:hypothetical protein